MAEQLGRMHKRFVVDGATIEFMPESRRARRGVRKPLTGHVFNFNQIGAQVLCSDTVQVQPGDRLSTTVNLRSRRAWIKAFAEVKWVRAVPSRPFKRMGVTFVDLGSADMRKLRDMEFEYAPIQENELKGQTARLMANYRLPSMSEE